MATSAAHGIAALSRECKLALLRRGPPFLQFTPSALRPTLSVGAALSAAADAVQPEGPTARAMHDVVTGSGANPFRSVPDGSALSEQLLVAVGITTGGPHAFDSVESLRNTWLNRWDKVLVLGDKANESLGIEAVQDRTASSMANYQSVFPSEGALRKLNEDFAATLPHAATHTFTCLDLIDLFGKRRQNRITWRTSFGILQ